jgi:Flp pilus assembly protein TadG
MRTSRLRRRTAGQSMVEFALVLPIFLLIVLGLVDLGRAVFSYTSITNAAR